MENASPEMSVSWWYAIGFTQKGGHLDYRNQWFG